MAQKTRKKRTKEEMTKERFDIAKRFSDEVVKRFGPLVKVVITWGSVTRKSFTKKSDIDCLVIVDDVSFNTANVNREAVDEDLYKIAKGIDKRISVQPIWLLSEFWNMISNQSPLVYSVLREGWALYDTGFFIPLRKLYEQGAFPTTTKSAHLKMENAPKRIKRVERIKVMAIFEDLFYAMIEPAQTVISYKGKEPPGIRASPTAIRDYFVKNGMLEEKYAKDLEDVVKFHKAVEHGEINGISGQELDEWIEKSKKFVARMDKLLKRLEKEKKTESINKINDYLLEVSTATLKSIKKMPKNENKIIDSVQKHLVKTGMVDAKYNGLLEKVLSMKKMTETNEVDKLSESEIDMARDYVQRFGIDLSKIMKKRKNN